MAQKYTINQDYFNMFNEENAYVYGFISTDGHITKGRPDRDERTLQIELSAKDIDILEQIKDSMGFTGPVHISKRNTCRIYVSNKTIINRLEELNMKLPKQEREFLTTIPDEFKRDYIRGIIDADGSYLLDDGRLKIQLLGNKNTLQNIIKEFNNLRMNHPIDNLRNRKNYGKNGANVYVKSYGYGDACKIIHWLYENATIFSKRKFKRIQEILFNMDENKIISKNTGAFLKLRELLENMDT